MKKFFILGFSLILLSQLTFAQKSVGKRPSSAKVAKPPTNSVKLDDSTLRANIKVIAEEISQAFIKGDYQKVFQMTHPKVQALIGKERFISEIEKGTKADEADGYKIVLVEVYEPKEIIHVGSQLFAVVPEKMRFQTPKGLFVGEASDVAISDNGGKTWTFVGGGGGGEASRKKLKVLFPTAADKIEIPEDTQPVPYQVQ